MLSVRPTAGSKVSACFRVTSANISKNRATSMNIELNIGVYQGATLACKDSKIIEIHQLEISTDFIRFQQLIGVMLSWKAPRKATSFHSHEVRHLRKSQQSAGDWMETGSNKGSIYNLYNHIKSI